MKLQSIIDGPAVVIGSTTTSAANMNSLQQLKARKRSAEELIIKLSRDASEASIVQPIAPHPPNRRAQGPIDTADAYVDTLVRGAHCIS